MSLCNIYIYIYIYIHTHTHIHIYIYISLNHFAIHQRLTQYCKSTIHQLNKNFFWISLTASKFYLRILFIIIKPNPSTFQLFGYYGILAYLRNLMLYKLFKWKKESLITEYFQNCNNKVIFSFRNFNNKRLVLLVVFCSYKPKISRANSLWWH